MSNTRNKLATDFCGMQFDTPLVLLSGCVGFGEEYTRVKGFSNRDAGAICLKGTTLEPRLGNPAHRVAETWMGMLNSIGLQNPGARKVVDEYLPELDFSETRFVANVCGSTIEEYAEVTRIFHDSPIDAIEVNISCPNIKEGGVSFGNYPEMSAQVVSACRNETDKPIITKLSPNQTDIVENARRCIDAGSDALAVINTVTGMAVDLDTGEPGIGPHQGALSDLAGLPGMQGQEHTDYRAGRHYHRKRRPGIPPGRSQRYRCRHRFVLRPPGLQEDQRRYRAIPGPARPGQCLGTGGCPEGENMTRCAGLDRLFRTIIRRDSGW